MPFYSFEMVLVGIILLTGMTFAAVRIWQKRRKEQNSPINTNKSLESNNDGI